MELLCLLMLLEERPVQLESSRQMVQRLLVVLIVEVGLSKLGVRPHQDEKILSVDIDQDLADGELLDPYLDLAIKILSHENLIKLFVFFN